jgi:hypothetical protein
VGVIILCIIGAVTCMMIRRRHVRRSRGEGTLVAAPFTSVNDSSPISISAGGSIHKSGYRDGGERYSVDGDRYPTLSPGTLAQSVLNVERHAPETMFEQSPGVDEGLQSRAGTQVNAATLSPHPSQHAFAYRPSTRSAFSSEYPPSSYAFSTPPAYPDAARGRSPPAYSDLSRNQSQRTFSEGLSHSSHAYPADIADRSGPRPESKGFGGFGRPTYYFNHRDGTRK